VRPNRMNHHVVFGPAAMCPDGIAFGNSAPALEAAPGTMSGGNVTIGPGPVGRPEPCCELVFGALVGVVVYPGIAGVCVSGTAEVEW